MGAFGIDVSRFQGNIDWGEVKRSGVEFAMLRAGFGTGSIDVQFRKNAEGCTRCGIPFGVYWFSYAYTPQMAADEAQQCFETVEDYDLAYPVCIDFEEDSVRYAATKGVTVTRGLATRIVEDFGQAARRAREATISTPTARAPARPRVWSRDSRNREVSPLMACSMV